MMDLKQVIFTGKGAIWMYTTKENLFRSLRLAAAITAAGILLLANLRFPYTFSFFFEAKVPSSSSSSKNDAEYISVLMPR